jgi:hypothetical protein
MYQTLLAKLARALDTGKIPYMVIGGQAVLFHGEPRLTRGVDITLGVDATGLGRVRSAIEGADLVPGVPDVETFVRSTNVLPLSELSTGIRVDLIFSFTPYEALAIGRAVTAVFNSVPVRFASAEDLIIHKLVAGRPRDIEDVAGVLARRPALDEGYLIHWLASFHEVVNRDLVFQFRTLIKKRDASGIPL